AASAAAATWRGRMTRLAYADGRLRVMNLALLAASLLCLAAAVIGAAGRWLDPSIERHAISFTRTCLSGNWNRAHEYLEDNAVARTEFDRWRVRYFPSIIDRIRPDGDRVEIEARLLANAGSSAALLVTMKSPFIGTRSHEQHWKHI